MKQKAKLKLTPIIGLEVHVGLATKSKMHCACSANHFQVKPNTHTCPVCLGLPGALPVPNQKAVEWTILLGQALNCRITELSKFDRKNYFYPDLPKGYQISQYDLPFASQGELIITPAGKIIHINRVHLEEDTAKLIHRDGASLVDFNRSGVPLIEIVSEPEINSADEAVVYLKTLQQIIRYLGISDADMEKGSMRLEPNISLGSMGWTVGDSLPDYKVEIKNINSFKFAHKAINCEIERQKILLERGERPKQETRGFDEKTGQTYVQRNKEAASDYRYFPEPDIPPINISASPHLHISKILPELPEEKQARFVKQYQLSDDNVQILTQTRELADYFEAAVKLGKKHQLSAQKLANHLINKKPKIKKVSPEELVKQLLSQQTTQVSDDQQISAWIEQEIKANPK
ncbi:Asp-tRNA(Asn)/Glu-tRNA(Gln) amidotransferase subunit GatB, partial [Patescibacteria group bacterium]|nr:Asp-tRNA(Asn)/Glu-tRNA(Gln) amidotransferase subunit GatB [Patescibacteria group bacterium]